MPLRGCFAKMASDSLYKHLLVPAQRSHLPAVTAREATEAARGRDGGASTLLGGATAVWPLGARAIGCKLYSLCAVY
jgi:hypothetical protein